MNGQVDLRQRDEADVSPKSEPCTEGGLGCASRRGYRGLATSG
jgi:hypothetical protein